MLVVLLGGIGWRRTAVFGSGRRSSVVGCCVNASASGESGLSAKAKERSRKHGVWGTILEIEEVHQQGEKVTQLLVGSSCQLGCNQSNVKVCGKKSKWLQPKDRQVSLEDGCHSRLEIDDEEFSCIAWARLQIDNGKGQAQQEADVMEQMSASVVHWHAQTSVDGLHSLS